MIQIAVDKVKRKEMEEKYLEDADGCNASIFKVLRTPTAKDLLESKYKKIYQMFYDKTTGELIEEEVKKLLLADRKGLEKYIDIFGEYESDKALSDELLHNIFRYDRYSKRKIVNTILQIMNVSVCPYCNRQYIFAITSRKVRPQLDHYYPKSKYPYLALSLYNMIPSCSTCNMSKSSLDTKIKPILYPYDEEFGDDVKFEIKIKNSANFVKVLQGVSGEFIIEIRTPETINQTTINTQVQKLHLDELYNKHIDYVMDIIKSKYINTPERIKEIYMKFPMLFHSSEEVKKMVYMADTRKESWGKRPLSKLTHDIDKQLAKGRIPLEAD